MWKSGKRRRSPRSWRREKTVKVKLRAPSTEKMKTSSVILKSSSVNLKMKRCGPRLSRS